MPWGSWLQNFLCGIQAIWIHSVFLGLPASFTPAFAPKTAPSLQTPLDYLRNLLIFKYIYVSLTSLANSLSRKDKSHFLA